MNKSFNENEINILWDMFIKDYPNASRSTKSQVIKKWKNGTYQNTVNANAIVLKYLNQLEQKEKVDKEWDRLDQANRDLDESYRELGQAQARLISEQETLKRNQRTNEIMKEGNEEMREIIKKLRLELIDEKGQYGYDAWADNNFNNTQKAQYGL